MQRTTLPWPSYQQLANEYYSRGIKPAAIKEILGEPVWEGESWHIKPSGNGGISRQRLKSRQRNKAKSNAERVSQSKIQTVGDKAFGSKIKGLQAHHLRMLSLYEPLFKGASEADQIALAQHAVKVGIPLGDVEANRGDLPSSVHDNLHNYMRKHGMTGKHMPDFSNADLDNRIKAFDVLYKDFIQPDIDSKTMSLMQDYRSKHPKQYQQKYSGSTNLPGVGQVNTSPKPPSTKLKVLRNTAKGLAVAGIVGVGPLGTAASASETITRHQIADMTQNPLDRAQAHISSFSLAADGASYAPPATFHATVASTAADILNAAIDTGRDIIDTWFSNI